MKKEDIIKKLKSLKLNLEVHPDNEEYSEFKDSIDDLDEILQSLTEPKEGVVSAEDKKLVDYIYEFAWQYGRLFHTEQSIEERLKTISEKFILPEQFLAMHTYASQTREEEMKKHAVGFLKYIDIYKNGLMNISYEDLYNDYKKEESEYLNRK